jgi:hypothetical protein
MNIDWGTVCNFLLSAVVLPALTWLAGELIALVRRKRKDSKLATYLEIATDCVIDAVGDIAQTFIDKLSEEEWNEETKKEAFNLAKEKALKHLGITGRALLEEALGDFDSWINSKIEAEVKRLSLKAGE